MSDPEMVKGIEHALACVSAARQGLDVPVVKPGDVSNAVAFTAVLGIATLLCGEIERLHGDPDQFLRGIYARVAWGES